MVKRSQTDLFTKFVSASIAFSSIDNFHINISDAPHFMSVVSLNDAITETQNIIQPASVCGGTSSPVVPRAT